MSTTSSSSSSFATAGSSSFRSIGVIEPEESEMGTPMVYCEEKLGHGVDDYKTIEWINSFVPEGNQFTDRKSAVESMQLLAEMLLLSREHSEDPNKHGFLIETPLSGRGKRESIETLLKAVMPKELYKTLGKSFTVANYRFHLSLSGSSTTQLSDGSAFDSTKRAFFPMHEIIHTIVSRYTPKSMFCPHGFLEKHADRWYICKNRKCLWRILFLLLNSRLARSALWDAGAKDVNAKYNHFDRFVSVVYLRNYYETLYDFVPMSSDFATPVHTNKIAFYVAPPAPVKPVARPIVHVRRTLNYDKEAAASFREEHKRDSASECLMRLAKATPSPSYTSDEEDDLPFFTEAPTRQVRRRGQYNNTSPQRVPEWHSEVECIAPSTIFKHRPLVLASEQEHGSHFPNPETTTTASSSLASTATTSTTPSFSSRQQNKKRKRVTKEKQPAAERPREENTYDSASIHIIRRGNYSALLYTPLFSGDVLLSGLSLYVTSEEKHYEVRGTFALARDPTTFETYPLFRSKSSEQILACKLDLDHRLYPYNFPSFLGRS